MNKLKIFVDFDNCSADSIYSIVQCFNTVDCTNYGDSSKVKLWNFQDLIPRADDLSVEQMFNSHLFWNNLKLYDGAKEFFNKYKDRIVIVSIGSIENQIKKIDWIHKNLGRIDMLPVITDMTIKHKTIDKSYIDMSNGILIEDSGSNIDMSNAKHKILFSDRGFDCEWNKDCKTADYRCNTWEEIEDIVEKLLENIE